MVKRDARKLLGSKSNTRFGVKEEAKIAQRYRRKGCKVEQPFRGIADLKVVHPSGKKVHIQVKATRTTSASNNYMKRSDAAKLKKSAKAAGASAVICLVNLKKKTVEYKKV